jgi:hypothetical protein
LVYAICPKSSKERFSRYSRSEKSIRRILIDEFINLPESGFNELVADVSAASRNQLVAVGQAGSIL